MIVHEVCYSMTWLDLITQMLSVKFLKLIYTPQGANRADYTLCSIRAPTCVVGLLVVEEEIVAEFERPRSINHWASLLLGTRLLRSGRLFGSSRAIIVAFTVQC